MATANERIVNGVKTRNLHGKDYVEVAERVRAVHDLKKAFKMLESGPIQVADRWLWRVVIEVDGMPYIGNAEAKLNAPKNTPDGTNPFECAETSALGRALAFAGLGTVEGIASYDEVARAQAFEQQHAASEQERPHVAQQSAAQPKQTVPIKQAAEPDPRKVALNALYTTGAKKDLWGTKAGMAVYAGRVLKRSIVPSELEALTEDEMMAFRKAVEAEKTPVAASTGK